MSVQPGGGFCYEIELAWGRLRRWYLKRFRSAYVARMAALREGDVTGAPHEILDPRDLKYCSTQCTAHWRPEHDPFRWREKLLLARWGLAELQIMGWPLVALALYLMGQGGLWRFTAIVPAALLLLLVYFFRDPPRRVPTAPGSIVSPADGTVVEISQIDDEFVGGPAVRIGIFLSIFNVHVNRAPLPARVVELKYRPGEFISATRPESAMRNESMWIGLEECDPPQRRFAVRQISGMLARRIVCNLKPQQAVARGEKFGMIKLGSRTELILPAAHVRLNVKVGDRVRGGCQIIAHWTTHPAPVRS
ncbi:MAG: phosphatidylserine decarboxylase [Pirellulales bacterium]